VFVDERRQDTQRRKPFLHPRERKRRPPQLVKERLQALELKRHVPDLAKAHEVGYNDARSVPLPRGGQCCAPPAGAAEG
jgi:hypothetical protein